jgi:hypothetical protein
MKRYTCSILLFIIAAIFAYNGEREHCYIWWAMAALAGHEASIKNHIDNAAGKKEIHIHGTVYTDETNADVVIVHGNLCMVSDVPEGTDNLTLEA